ncbi:hypothetical protein NPJ88_015000 [Halomonas elongata]|uniref:hypothetical protein n=1 Tax=Halomonas elongata TaxID=2746 RepID=UPI00255AA224|nr:hypothetical protein [Halomonas elongata]MDL4863645.1 hypothetical protein [Halomonas elongata]
MLGILLTSALRFSGDTRLFISISPGYGGVSISLRYFDGCLTGRASSTKNDKDSHLPWEVLLLECVVAWMATA